MLHQRAYVCLQHVSIFINARIWDMYS